MLEPATPDDLRRILELVNEYTAKLRSVCDRYNATRDRRVQWVMAIALMGATMGALVVTLLPKLSSDVRDPLSATLIALMVTVVTVGVAATFTFTAVGTTKIVYDAHQLAATVERLIRTASQYQEHATNRIADKFEFDLRLAEAEAALRVYQDTFKRSSAERFAMRASSR